MWKASRSAVLILLLGAIQVVGAADLASPQWRQTLDRISANSLRGHVSFLASDLLEGRATPSRGLELAAEYIAAQFRRAGLEPAGDDGYFQTARFARHEAGSEAKGLTFTANAGVVRLAGVQIAASCPAALDIAENAVVKSREAALPKLDGRTVKGKVLLIEDADSGRRDPRRVLRQFGDQTRSLEPALILVPVSNESRLRAMREPVLFDPEKPPSEGPPVIGFLDSDAAKLTESKGDLKVSAHCGARVEKEYTLRNVLGLLRGSDPSLADTVVVVSAHYDHVGMKEAGEGDRIYNGANDDASGTTAVIDIAASVAAFGEKPKRSILFAAFFGEEEGMLGSRYYVRHPVIPLAKTVANINIEQVGRPWPEEKSGKLKASVTGFDYSGVVGILQSASKLTGVELQKRKGDGDFFLASDNIAFAEKGIPAHTVCTSFHFPDYHQPGDHWDKLDYESMAGVTRMIALAALMAADSLEPPEWNEKSSKTERFRKARVKE